MGQDHTVSNGFSNDDNMNDWRFPENSGFDTASLTYIFAFYLIYSYIRVFM